MASGTYRFDRFLLDPGDRQLKRDDVPVELNARYLDALALLVTEAGKLVSKERFLQEVWRGVPVTDEALTHCIKTLRRQLGDNAARPRFIETVPKHGYRFIATVEGQVDYPASSVTFPTVSIPEAKPAYAWRQVLLFGGAGTLGAGIAGVVGGLFYGFAAASQPAELNGGVPGMGAASLLLVILWLTIAAALTGGAGVSFSIAASGLVSDREWGKILGGVLGGLSVGGIVKLLGLDAFNLLLGRSPGDITGGTEGMLLGGAVGLGYWLSSRGTGQRSLRISVAQAAVVGGAVGIFIPLSGGRLMGGSLDLLSRGFPGSSLQMDSIGRLFGEDGFGPISQVVMGGLEGALFSGCIVAAIFIARRSLTVDA